MGHEQLEAIVDTGFNGNLLLPSSLVDRMGLLRHGPSLSRFSDGSVREGYLYVVEIEWLNGPVRCLAGESDLPECLLGTALLDGRVLTIDFGPEKKVEVR